MRRDWRRRQRYIDTKRDMPVTTFKAVGKVLSITATWTVREGATLYQVDYRLAGTQTWTAAWIGTQPTCSLPALSPLTQYDVRMRALVMGMWTPFIQTRTTTLSL